MDRQVSKLKLPEVGPNLYVRGRLPQHPDLGARLRASGVRVMMSLHRQGEPVLEGKEQQDVRYIHEQLVDSHHSVDEEQVVRLARTVAFYLDRDVGVLVGCMGGKNRSALVAAAGGMLSWGVDADEIILRVKRARPTAFENRYFEQWLREWDPSRVKALG